MQRVVPTARYTFFLEDDWLFITKYDDHDDKPLKDITTVLLLSVPPSLTQAVTTRTHACT